MPLKKSSLRLIPAVILGSLLVTQFQNCSQGLEGEESFSSLTNASTIDQLHQDYSHGRDIPTEPEKALEVSALLMDRMTLYNFFVDTFGPASVGFSSMKRLKTEKAIFGGPCSVYDNFRSVRSGLVANSDLYKIDAEATTCANSESALHLAAPIEPSANVLHQALVNQVCEQLSEGTTTYRYVVTQVRGATTTGAPANTPVHAQRLFSLFYRGKPNASVEIIESLQMQIGNPASVAGWKDAIRTVCLSSHWQAL